MNYDLLEKHKQIDDIYTESIKCEEYDDISINNEESKDK